MSSREQGSMKYNFTQMFVSLKVECRQSSYLLIVFLQRRASDQWQGFEDKNLGSSPSLLGQWVATVTADQRGELPIPAYIESAFRILILFLVIPIPYGFNLCG